MSTPGRFWLTGGVAAVLAAASEPRPRAHQRSSRSSRYSVRETVERIEREARQHGLPVFARFSTLPAQSKPTSLLVLGSDDEHTLVIEDSPQDGLALPLTVSVAASDDGGAEVGFADPGWVADHGELPPELVARVAALPALIEAALSAGQRAGA